MEPIDVPKLLEGVTAHHRKYLQARFGVTLAESPTLKDLELFIQIGLFLLAREQIKAMEAKAKGRKVAAPRKKPKRKSKKAKR